MANYVDLGELKTVLERRGPVPRRAARRTSRPPRRTSSCPCCPGTSTPSTSCAARTGDEVTARTVGFHKLFVGQTIDVTACRRT